VNTGFIPGRKIQRQTNEGISALFLQWQQQKNTKKKFNTSNVIDDICADHCKSSA